MGVQWLAHKMQMKPGQELSGVSGILTGTCGHAEFQGLGDQARDIKHGVAC